MLSWRNLPCLSDLLGCYCDDQGERKNVLHLARVGCGGVGGIPVHSSGKEHLVIEVKNARLAAVENEGCFPNKLHIIVHSPTVDKFVHKKK